MLSKKFILVAAAVFAVAAPATSSAKKPEGVGSGKSKGDVVSDKSHSSKSADKGGSDTPRGRNHLVHGTVSAVDVAGGLVTVTVSTGNSAAQALAGQSVEFNLSGAKLQILDANGDAVGDLNDVAVGDHVQVHANVASGASQPYGAKRFKDHDVGATDSDTNTETGTETPPAS